MSERKFEVVPQEGGVIEAGQQTAGVCYFQHRVFLSGPISCDWEERTVYYRHVYLDGGAILA